MEIIGRKVIAGGCTGILKGYRRQEARDPKGRILTPPDKRWFVVVDLTEDKSNEDELVNHYPAEVRFADTGEAIPAAPPTLADELRS